MSRVSSSPGTSTAPTAAAAGLSTPFTAKGSPTFSLGGTPRMMRSGGGFNGAVPPSSSRGSHSPLLLSPAEGGGDGLTSVQSASGPSSAAAPRNLTASASAPAAPGHEASCDGPDELPDARQLHRPQSDHERVLRLKETELVRLRRTVQELSAQLNTALCTLDTRADTAAELQALKDSNAAEQARRDGEVREVRLDMLESRVKFRAVETELSAKYEGDVQAKATELLATHTKEVHEANFELLKEKLLLAQEVDVNRVEYKELQSSYQKLRRETQLDAEANAQLLQRSVQQKTQIASLREQVKMSEDNLNSVVLEYDKKLREQERRHQAAVDALTKERDDARRDALRLKRDLQQLRSTAGSVLSQRSELDDFFYAALAEVRRRVVEERHQMLAGGQPSATMEGTKGATFSPAQTATSILRLETTERLLITGSPPSVPTNNTASAQRTGYRKGPSKPSAAASARQAPSSRNSVNGSLLPPVGTTSRGPRSAPAAAPLEGAGTLVSVPHATPAYLRASADDTQTSSVEAAAASFASSSGARGGVQTDGVEEAEQPSQRGAPSTPMPPTSVHLPSLRSLPPQPTWKDVKDVDVTQLSWADKERVLQLLFKRIQEERRHRARSHAREAAAAPVESAGDAEAPRFDRDVDSATFLTQT